jgi:hypothetical protein
LVGLEEVGWIDFLGEGCGIIQLRNKTPEQVIEEFNGGEHKLEFSIPTGK